MKNIIYFLFFAFTIPSFAQTHIPDKNFANAIREKCPTCIDGNDNLTAVASNLLKLDIKNKGIKSLEGLEFFTNLINLDCSYNQLSILPILPNNLQVLGCNNNKLTILPALPESLKELECASNQLIVLPKLPQKMQELYCQDNQLIALNVLPQNLQILFCSYNQFSTLPALPQSLEWLYCDKNQLKVLPTLPQNLLTLSCSKNQLAFLPTLPESLQELICSNNQISTLTILPEKLQRLDCYSNQLTVLPALPQNLKELQCYNNQFKVLPTLPESLKTLDCSDNQLLILPSLPANLLVLRCFYNQLITLPILPQKLIELSCSYNQQLSCINNLLPLSIHSLTTTNTNIKCLPNKPIGIANNPLPICDATNSNSCFAFPKIKGNVFLDFNDDGIKNNDDVFVTNQLMEVNPYGFAITDSNGNFSMASDTSKSLIINVKNIPSKFVVKPIERKLNTSPAFLQTYDKQDFRLVPTEIFSDIEVNIVSSVQRPGFEGTLTLTYRNIGTTVLNGQIKLEKDPILLYVSAIPTENEINGHTIIWNYSNLIPFESRSITVKVKVPATTPINSKLTNKMFATFNILGTYYESQKATELTTVVGSYDPNDKTADVPNLDPKDIVARKPITYTIRFQNTGNYHAERVEVQDTISPLFDLSTLKTIAVSHPNCTVSIEKDRFKTGQPTFVKWTFENIILPDSTTNEAASHGFVRFSIQPKQGLSIGTSLDNKAFIYFDYNLPIITNTSKVKVEKTSKTKENELEIPLKVYPNPSSDKIFVETNIAINGTLTLSNLLGQVYDYQSFKSSEVSVLDIQHLPKGVYVLTLKTDNGNVSRRVVKE